MSIDLRFFLRQMGQKIRRSPQIPLCGVALNVLIGFVQPVEKLLFVGMPPRAMRAFARVVIFPSFGHARFVFAVVVYSI